MPWILITSAKEASRTKKLLEQSGLYDKNRKVTKLADGEVSIPIKTEEATFEAGNEKTLSKYPFSRVEFIELEQGLERHKMPPHKKLEDNIRGLLSKYDVEPGESFMTELPKCWEIHSDLVLLPEQSFRSKFWDQFGVELWSVIAAGLGVKKVAKKSVISNDDYRTPNVKLLLGNNGIVSHMDNKIKYSYDITKCMFSSGNVTEKIRIGKLDCSGETVVDLYAGIGYFVLPFLVHSKAALVHACEWNKNAIEALRDNVRLNNVEGRCMIHEGDNREFPYRGIADRVNLGLIPSSEAGWAMACAVLKSDKGGWLHVHGNVSSDLKLDAVRKKNKLSCDAGEDAKVTDINKESLKRQQSYCGSFALNFNHLKGRGVPREANSFESSDQNQSSTSVMLDSSGDAAGICFSETDKCDGVRECEQRDSGGLEQRDHEMQHRINKGNYDERTERSGKLDPTIKGLNTTGVKECAVNIPSCNKRIKQEWTEWAHHVVHSLKSLLCEAHCTSGVHDWIVLVGHLEHVKSYAPHISHLVLDVECRPVIL